MLLTKQNNRKQNVLRHWYDENGLVGVICSAHKIHKKAHKHKQLFQEYIFTHSIAPITTPSIFVCFLSDRLFYNNRTCFNRKLKIIHINNKIKHA